MANNHKKLFLASCACAVTSGMLAIAYWIDVVYRYQHPAGISMSAMGEALFCMALIHIATITGAICSLCERSWRMVAINLGIIAVFWIAAALSPI